MPMGGIHLFEILCNDRTEAPVSNDVAFQIHSRGDFSQDDPLVLQFKYRPLRDV